MNTGNLLNRVQLLVTDLDGTLLGPKPEFKYYNTFRDSIARMRQNPDFVWAICTGRSLNSYRHSFLPLRSFGIKPDFVITRHAYIFQHQRVGYVPHLIWNLRIRALQWYHKMRMDYALPRLRKALAQRIPFVRIGEMDHVHVSFKFEDEEITRAAADFLREIVKNYHYLQVFQFHNEVLVDMIPFTKGLSLEEMARKIDVPTSKILVIGDGHNDISMMSPRVAEYCACPANSALEVIQYVHTRGGHIARAECLEGAIEILDAFSTGAINSDMPTDWVNPATLDRPASKSRFRHHKRDRKLRSWLILMSVIYTTLLVFATFGLIPYSTQIKKPFVLLGG